MSPPTTNSPAQGKYSKSAQLTYNGRAVCLCAEDGKLACGGSDGVRIWNMRTKTLLRRPAGAGLRGATTALTWIRHEDNLEVGLAYGTQAGFLVGWKETRRLENGELTFEESYCAQVANPSEITDISYDGALNYLAVCNRNAVIQLFALDTMIVLRNIFSVTVNDFVPRAIAFGPINGESRNVLAFGLHDGQILTLRATDGQVEHSLKTGCMIGDADVNTRGGVFCIDDPAEGAALYRLGTGVRVRTYPVAVTKAMRARQVTFAEDYSQIAIGSDHGIIYVFDRRSGAVLDKLDIDSDGWAQMVVAMDFDGVPTIISTRPGGDGEESVIMIWKKKKVQQFSDPMPRPREHTKHTTVSALQFCMFVASVAFIWQNVTVLMETTTKILVYLFSYAV